MRVFDLGCGVGNAMIPLLKENNELSFVGVDISKHAVIVLESKLQRTYPGRARVYQWAAGTSPPPQQIQAEMGSFDIVLLIFVLSAIDPQDMVALLKNANQVSRCVARCGLEVMRLLWFSAAQARREGA